MSGLLLCMKRILHVCSSYTLQGVVTPIRAVLTAETGDMTRSPGHGGFFPFGHGVTTVFRGIS